jgi:hypothetical protein
MILGNYHVEFNTNLNINSISSYKIIRNKFFAKYISIYEYKYSDKKTLYTDALIYSKYYLYYKTQNCIYSPEIMDIIYNIDFFK